MRRAQRQRGTGNEETLQQRADGSAHGLSLFEVTGMA